MADRLKFTLLGALAALGGLVMCALAALRWPAAHWVDTTVLQGFVSLRSSQLHAPASVLVHIADPLPYAVFSTLLVGLALLRGQPRVALVIAVVLPVAAATTELLKQLLATPRLAPALGDGQLSAASFPSGHATASMALALALVLAVAPRMRSAAATLGAGLTVAVSYSLLTLGWHYPSDVLGGYLVACVSTLVAAASLQWAAGRWPARAGRRAVADALQRARAQRADRSAAVDQAASLPRAWEIVRVPTTVGIVAGAFATLVAISRPDAALEFVQNHHAVLVGAAVIAGSALMVALVTAALTSQRG